MKVFAVLAIGVSFLFVGCASKQIQAKVNVMRQEGGSVLAIASSSTEAIAYDGAKAKAEEYCFKHNKDFLVVKEEAAYQGADKTTKGIASAVGGLFGKSTGGNSLDDYKVKVVFKCDGPYTGKGEPFPRTLDLSGNTYH